jgi:CRISPR-associated protein Cas2
MQHRYIVTYDITEDSRRTAVYKALRGFGDHLQYSVFRCDLNDRRRIELTGVLHELVDHTTDQVLIIDLGPVDGRAATCVSSIGRSYRNPERSAVIV